MGLFDGFDIEHLIERLLDHIDLEAITADVMKNIRIEDLELFLVVRRDMTIQGYEFAGMAFSMKAAKEIWARQNNRTTTTIFKVDFANLVTFLEDTGVLERVLM